MIHKECYKPVWRQLRKLFPSVNKRRKEAGFAAVSMSAIRWRRQIVKAFEPAEGDAAA